MWQVVLVRVPIAIIIIVIRSIHSSAYAYVRERYSCIWSDRVCRGTEKCVCANEMEAEIERCKKESKSTRATSVWRRNFCIVITQHVQICGWQNILIPTWKLASFSLLRQNNDSRDGRILIVRIDIALGERKFLGNYPNFPSRVSLHPFIRTWKFMEGHNVFRAENRRHISFLLIDDKNYIYMNEAMHNENKKWNKYRTKQTSTERYYTHVSYSIQHHTMLWNGRLCVNSRRQTDRQSTGMSARNSSLSLVGNTFYCANSIEFVRTKNKNIRKNNNNNRGAAVRSNEFRMAMRHSLAMYQIRSLQLKKTVNGTKWCCRKAF